MSEQPHPEDFCQKCGAKNPIWFAPSDLWNKYTTHSILCPTCFATLLPDNIVWNIAPESLESDWQQRAIAAEAERQRIWELFKDESDQDSEVREILKQFDTSDSYCYEPTPDLAKKCLAAKESAEQTIKALEKKLERADEFGQRGFQALVKALGLKTPLELIARAENNEETHLDIAVKVVAEKMNQLSAAEQTIAELRAHITHPQIHIDYYEWRKRIQDSDPLAVKMIERHTTPESAHALLIFAYSAAREELQSTLNKKAK